MWSSLESVDSEMPAIGVAAASITSGCQITEVAKDSADQPALAKVHGRLGVVGWLSLAMECSLL